MATILVCAGSQLARSIEPADIKVNDWKLQVRNETFNIDPPTLKTATWDGELKDGEPGWRGPTLLPGPAWAYAALRADTLVVTRADDPSVHLEVGKDFALDPKWAAIAAVKGSKFPAGTKVHCEYKYGLSRTDLISASSDGKLTLTRGVEDKSVPLLPDVPKGQTPVLSVYLPNGIRHLSNENINLIDPAYDGVPPVIRAETLAPVKQ
jgi:hypothetical protein